MKWLGQHIVDLIARFRSDVYLEDISTGTIASGSNLGLDSNNKIVKATEATGDITSVAFQTDSGAPAAAEAASGDANFRINGSSGVGVTNIGTAITATSVPGEIDHDSLLNFASNEHFTQANITTVGTIGTGVWQGTTIKTDYIGDDQVTEDKLANTLLAEIDANTAKVTNVATNLTATTHASQITINSSDGTNVIVAEASGSIAGVMSVTHHDKLDAIEASATADQSKSDIDGLAITTVGTIDNGVWEGTAIASDQQKHLMHYQFLGYTTGDGSSYEMPQNLTDGQAPFEHADTSSSDGLTIPATSGTNQRDMIRMGGHLMVNVGTLKNWKGIATNNNNKDLTIGLFKWTPADNSAGDMTPVLLEEVVIEGKGNNLTRTFSTTSFEASGAVAVGDIIFTQMKTETSGNVAFFNSTLEVEF